MVNEAAVKIANMVYGLDNVKTKDEIIAVVSALLRSENNVLLNNVEDRINKDRIKEIVNISFSTDKNENEYKHILAITLLIASMHIPMKNVDIFDDGNLTVDVSGAIKAGRVGKFKLYRLGD